MNSKKIIWMSLVAVAIVVLAIALALAGKKGTNNNQAGPGVDSGSMENATPQSVVPVPETIDWKKEAGADFKVEFMNDSEKQDMGIPPETKVQVLARDKETGVVLAYKIINAESDIINSLEQ